MTSTAVWLSEMGIDIALVRFQAYRVGDRVLVSASTLYPITDIEEFIVAPTRAAQRGASQPDLPVVQWTQEDYVEFAKIVSNPTVIAALDLCSTTPMQWIPLRTIQARADRTRFQARGDLAGLAMMIKSRFHRSNWPFEAEWKAGREEQVYYRMTDEQTRYRQEAWNPGEQAVSGNAD